MRQQVVGFCELYMLVMGSWSVMGGSTLKLTCMVKVCTLYNHHNPEIVELDLVAAIEGLQFKG